MLILRIVTVPLVLLIAGCTAESSEPEPATPASPAASADPLVTPPAAIDNELARYEFNGGFANSRHSGEKPKSGTDYAIKAACSGADKASFTVSKGGKKKIVEFDVGCDGSTTLNELGTDLPGPPIQIDMDLDAVTSAWAVIAPLDNLHS